mmetsp:Transcript_79928/g.226083  ORF Transcript_79928/g.226083 Transcript_79928/m.226083 type:complete len:442 (-) Transcript_79928:152-1477(-)
MGGPPSAEKDLLQYLEESYMMDAPLSLATVQTLLGSPSSQALSWTLRSEDCLPLLHLAAMNEATPADELGAVVSELLLRGAPPDSKDDDGDTALDAVLQLAGDAEADNQGMSDSAKRANLAAVQALLRCPAQPVLSAQVLAVCAWLRRQMPEDGRRPVLAELEARAGARAVSAAWASEELLAYLERLAYEEKAGVEPRRVRKFLERGASPGHTQFGATALLLLVLNPYSSYAQLVETFRAMLTAEPKVATVRDSFKLLPMQWAADYVNVAQQHGLTRPNPAAFLALMPCILTLVPPELDAGEACPCVARDGRCCPSSRPTRLLEGARALCRVCAPGGVYEWEEGVVAGLWYREPSWPAEHPGAPYEVLLDIGTRVFALVDDDRIVRPEALGAPRAAPAPASQSKCGRRFKKQQRPDGTWELLDTVSGKTRPASPPDSDDEA